MYQAAKEMARFAFHISKGLPVEYRHNISDQLTRASLSVVLNIAEGSGKSADRISDKELNRYFQIALGSIYEVFAVTDFLRDFKIVSDPDIDRLQQQLTNIASQLVGFKKSLLGRES